MKRILILQDGQAFFSSLNCTFSDTEVSRIHQENGPMVLYAPSQKEFSHKLLRNYTLFFLLKYQENPNSKTFSSPHII